MNLKHFSKLSIIYSSLLQLRTFCQNSLFIKNIPAGAAELMILMSKSFTDSYILIIIISSPCLYYCIQMSSSKASC